MSAKQAVNKPPKEWWDKHYDEVKKGNPDYSDEQVRKTVGDIWYHQMSLGQKQKETKKREGTVKTTAQEKNRFEVEIPSSVHDALISSPTGFEAIKKLITQSSGDKAIATADELMAARDELMQFLQRVTEQQLGDDITDLLMSIDEELFANQQSSQQSKEVDEAIEGTMGNLDELFKNGTKQAAGFPNLFSNDTKKWIQLQTTNLAAKEGTPASPEQAQAFIDHAADQVAQELALAVNPEVKKVVEEFRDQIFEDITSGVELAGPQPAGKPIPTSPTARPAAPGVAAPKAAPTATAGKLARMNEALARAFDNSYAYDAVAYVLTAELGENFAKEFAADEVIDEEEMLLDIVQQDFPMLQRNELSDAFGNVITDAYSKH